MPGPQRDVPWLAGPEIDQTGPVLKVWMSNGTKTEKRTTRIGRGPQQTTVRRVHHATYAIGPALGRADDVDSWLSRAHVLFLTSSQTGLDAATLSQKARLIGGDGVLRELAVTTVPLVSGALVSARAAAFLRGPLEPGVRWASPDTYTPLEQAGFAFDAD